MTFSLQEPSETVEKWQEIVNLIAKIVEVPAALIMKVEPPNITVFVSSESTGNPYERGELAPLNTGLYCETVMKSRERLLVPDALADKEWKSNPDVKLGMVSYLGFPITWPTGEIFGTICVLDNKRNNYSDLHHRLLLQFRDVLEADLKSLVGVESRLREETKAKADLETRVSASAEELQRTNQALIAEVDERTRVAEELLRKTAQLDELFELAPEAIVLLDIEDRVLRINKEFTRVFGYARDEIVGQSVNDLIVPDELRAEAEDFTYRITHGRALNAETVRRRKDGSRVHVSLLAVPISVASGQIAEYAVYGDISDRKELENQLKFERDRLKLLLELSNNLASKLDLRQLFETFAGRLFAIMHCGQAALILPDSTSGQLRVEMAYLPSGRSDSHEGLIVPLKGSVSGKVFRTGKPLCVGNFADLCDDPDVYGNPEGRRFYQQITAHGMNSGCFLPLIARDRVLGVVHSTRQPENAFSNDDLNFLERVAEQIAIAVENALQFRELAESQKRLEEQSIYLQEEIRSDHDFGEIIGQSPSLKAVLQQVSTVAPTDSSVLITGETGTGKELVARAIHDRSNRRERPFVKINCAAIPLGLLESELFGHEKGAFTGAIAQKTGRFELADKGTLFLDEVGDTPLELQAKLLRVLQEQEFERLGSNRTRKVDVRVVAATNRDLAKMLEARQFRSDLYYRLRVFPIAIPSLRERADDIPRLVHHFVSHFARRMNKKIGEIPASVMQTLVQYRWSGNIRELQNFIERAVILSGGRVLTPPMAELRPQDAGLPANRSSEENAASERDQIVRVLNETNWVVGGPMAPLPGWV